MSDDPNLQALIAYFDDKMDKFEGRLTNSLEKIERRIEGVESEQISIGKTLVLHDANLENHMQRTALAEQTLTIHQNQIEEVSNSLATRLAASESFINEIKKIGKIVSWLIGALVGAGLLDRVLEKLL